MPTKRTWAACTFPCVHALAMFKTGPYSFCLQQKALGSLDESFLKRIPLRLKLIGTYLFEYVKSMKLHVLCYMH